MKAMVLEQCTPFSSGSAPLVLKDLPVPQPKHDEILIKVKVCGVCHTEIDEIEGRTRPAFFPIIPGHQVIGTVAMAGKSAGVFTEGARVGLGWIFSSCGVCSFCLSGRENLCPRFIATGRDAHGGYAQFMLAKTAFAFPLSAWFDQIETAPLFCAGGVGYRALRASGIANGQILGFSGFGASAHLLLKLIKKMLPRTTVFVFARNSLQREYAAALGAHWTGGFQDDPPEQLDAIIDTTPVWEPLARLLPHLKPGGRFVINAIRKEDTDKEFLAALSYDRHLWLEKEILTIANVTKKDIAEFLVLAERFEIRAEATVHPLEEANEALRLIRKGGQTGAGVLAFE